MEGDSGAGFYGFGPDILAEVEEGPLPLPAGPDVGSEPQHLHHRPIHSPIERMSCGEGRHCGYQEQLFPDCY